MENYSFWTDEELHEVDGQDDRQWSACHKKLTPILVDAEHQMCRIKGTGKTAYEVYLDSCTCGDFRNRRKPCKHMYRLAHELGVFQLPREPEVANIVPLSSDGNIHKYVDTRSGEITESPVEPKRLGFSDEIEANLKTIKFKLMKMPLSDLYAIGRNVPNGNSLYNSIWRKVVFEKRAAELLVELGLFKQLEATMDEKMKLMNRYELADLLDMVDKEQVINRKSITKTWIKRLIEEFGEALEKINNESFLLEATPDIGWRYATINTYIYSHCIKCVACKECGKADAHKIAVTDAIERVEKSEGCTDCGGQLAAVKECNLCYGDDPNNFVVFEFPPEAYEYLQEADL